LKNNMLEYIFAFIVGGLITTLIIVFENSNHPTLSRLATLFPVFTWLSYLFIGKFHGAREVVSHSKFVLWGTIFCWLPYMLVIIYFSPKIGPTKAIILAVTAFIILAIFYIYAVKSFKIF